MKQLRIAVIGAGHLGRFHTRLLKQIDGVDLAGVADPIESARTQLAAECGVEAFADYKQLIGRIDAAVVATPTLLHHEVAMQLLPAGIHLLVEKPIAATTAQAVEMVSAARQAGVVLQVGHIERFNPALTAVEGRLSEPKYIEAARMSGYTFRSTDIGVVLDLMIHDIDLVLSLTKSTVTHVDALGVSVMGEHEDIAQARLTLASGCVVNLTASRVSYLPQRTMQIWSREGFASVDFSTRSSTLVQPHPRLLELQRSGASAVSADEKARLKDHLFEDLLPMTKQQPDATNALLDELVDFVHSIRDGHAPRVTGEDGCHALQVAYQVLDSIQSHAWDGNASGPVGPRLARSPQILRGPHWGLQPAVARHKEAS